MIEATKRFECYLKRRYGDRSTPKHYLSDLRIFIQHLDDKSPQQVTVQDIDHFIDQQVSQGLSPATINRRLATLHTFFEFLAAEEPDQEWPNPVVWRRHRVKQGTHMPQDASDAAVERLFRVIDHPRDRAMFGLMVGAGLRVGEVAALRVNDLRISSDPGEMTRLRILGKGRKERIVWLTPALYATVQDWLDERPLVESDWLFLNQHGRPLTVAGIQYRLQKHCAEAGVSLTCHQLRHTFARRLAEGDMPVGSLAKLLGHAQVETTQVYIAAANLDVRAAFTEATARWQETLADQPSPAPHWLVWPPSKPERVDPADLARCQAMVDDLPGWVRDPLQQYLAHRWRDWRPHTAFSLGQNLAQRLRRIWMWLVQEQGVSNWASLKRSDLEAWFNSRQQAGIATSTQTTELAEMRGFLRFALDEGLPVSANLFRVAYPRRPDPLPRALSEEEYRRLEHLVLSKTSGKSSEEALDRAWFLTLAHTGVRIGELLNLRLGDVDGSTELAEVLTGGRLQVRGGKNACDRIVYLTPALCQALQRYLSHRPTVEDDHLWWVKGRPLGLYRVRRLLRTWGKLAGVSVTPHQLRHTLASRLVNRGMRIELIRRLLGHRYLNSTQIYARVYDNTVQDHFHSAMARIEGIPLSNWPHPLALPVESPEFEQVADLV